MARAFAPYKATCQQEQPNFTPLIYPSAQVFVYQYMKLQVIKAGTASGSAQGGASDEEKSLSAASKKTDERWVGSGACARACVEPMPTL